MTLFAVAPYRRYSVCESPHQKTEVVIVSRRIISVGIAALAVLGVTVAGIGTASASSEWKVQLINANMPSATGSVKVVYSASGQTVCVKPNTSSNTTDTGVTNRWGNTLDVTPYGDANCSGSTTGAGVVYKFNENDDVSENNLNCTTVAVGVNTAEHAFRLCS